MPRRSDGATIQQIVDAADKIMRRSQSLSYDQFLEHDEKQDALIRPLEIMGEAVSRVISDSESRLNAVEYRQGPAESIDSWV
jgi:uncharacterized protein with HEPN domain